MLSSLQIMRRVDRSWNFYGSEVSEDILKPLCEKVESHFVFLSPKRLCRHFPTHDDSYLSSSTNFGKYYRGFHLPVESRFGFPDGLLHSFFRSCTQETINIPFKDTIAFDNLVYVRSTICREGGVGFVLTYAHELQHFMQHGYTPKLSKVNFVLYKNLKLYEQDAIATDIPNEREANIVSKRIAEKICGIATVQAYVEKQILFMGARSETQINETDRYFSCDVPLSTDYDLTQETLRLVEKYKHVIDFKIDVTQPEWWVG